MFFSLGIFAFSFRGHYRFLVMIVPASSLRLGVPFSIFAIITYPDDSIVKDKIGDVSVKLQFSQEDAWTRALRHVLLALKILLKWATSGNNA